MMEYFLSALIVVIAGAFIYTAWSMVKLSPEEKQYLK